MRPTRRRGTPVVDLSIPSSRASIAPLLQRAIQQKKCKVVNVMFVMLIEGRCPLDRIVAILFKVAQ
jgi:hypothetical protein